MGSCTRHTFRMRHRCTHGQSRARPSLIVDDFLFRKLMNIMPIQLNFSNCVARNLPFLTRVVRGVMRGDQSAEDVVQQTVLKALTNADQFRFESSLKTWLVSIAINEARQAYRSGWRRRTVPLMTEDADSIHSQPFESSTNNCQAKERAALVRTAVSRLPQPYRCVIELCDLQQLPMREAARQLGLTLSVLRAGDTGRGKSFCLL